MQLLLTLGIAALLAGALYGVYLLQRAMRPK